MTFGRGVGVGLRVDFFFRPGVGGYVKFLRFERKRVVFQGKNSRFLALIYALKPVFQGLQEKNSLNTHFTLLKFKYNSVKNIMKIQSS